MNTRSKVRCEKCKQEKDAWHEENEPVPAICGECSAMRSDAEMQKYLDNLATLPLEERLRRLEEYDLQAKKSRIIQAEYRRIGIPV